MYQGETNQVKITGGETTLHHNNTSGSGIFVYRFLKHFCGILPNFCWWCQLMDQHVRAPQSDRMNQSDWLIASIWEAPTGWSINWHHHQTYFWWWASIDGPARRSPSKWPNEPIKLAHSVNLWGTDGLVHQLAPSPEDYEFSNWHITIGRINWWKYDQSSNYACISVPNIFFRPISNCLWDQKQLCSWHTCDILVGNILMPNYANEGRTEKGRTKWGRKLNSINNSYNHRGWYKSTLLAYQ